MLTVNENSNKKLEKSLSLDLTHQSTLKVKDEKFSPNIKEPNERSDG